MSRPSKHHIGVAREMRRHPLGPQLDELRGFGCARPIVLVDGWPAWVELVNAIRENDVVHVRHLHLLPPPRQSTAESRRRFLWRCVHDIERRPARWIETSTGRKSWVPEERDAAIEDAIEYITREAHGLARRIAQRNGRKGGGIAREFPRDVWESAFALWTDPKLTGEKLVTALDALEWKEDRCRRKFGPRQRAKFPDTLE